MIIEVDKDGHIIMRVELDDGTIHFLKLNQQTVDTILADTPSHLKQYVVTTTNPDERIHVITNRFERAFSVAEKFAKGKVLSFDYYGEANGTND